MEQLPYKVASVLKQIKEQIDITSHRQLGWLADEEADERQVIVMTSEPYRKLGLKLMVQKTLYFCDINYYELENILEKIEEMKFIKSFFLVDDEVGGNSNYFKIVPEKNFNKLYIKFNIGKTLNGDIDSGPIDGNNVFPEAVMKKLPPDVQSICDEFNFNFLNKKTAASMLLLRRLLPLSIVRKFQALGRESEIKDNGNYLDTKALLGKIQSYLKEKRSYNEIMGYKLLTDSSQHSYTFIPQPEDVKGAALAIRIFLEDLFQ